jgi:polyhydroxyalkanoate synthesis regulator phasin
MTEQSEKKPDPWAQMLQFYDEWAKAWAAPMSQMVSSKPVADAMAQQMEAGLAAAGFMRRQMTDLMEQTLQQMNLPSRKEVLSLAERFTAFEMRLDDIEAKLDQALDLLEAKGA